MKYPNLGSRLDQLVARVAEGETSAGEAAEEALVRREESVAVTINLSGNVDAVVSFLDDNGGDPRNVGEDYVEAYAPVSLLGPLSEQPGVIRVREIIPPEPGQVAQRVAGHGPPVHGSAAWNREGYTGRGVKVGIIDVGFEGFRGLMGTELPATVVARCYTETGVFTRDLTDCAVDDSHGTSVAETVIDIAPKVSLYIANPVSRGDLRQTVAWMVSEGVLVINESLRWLFDGPGDGTSPFGDSPLNTVDRAVDGGAVWVNSAGNLARTTWFGDYVDTDEDDFVSFAEPEVEFVRLDVKEGERVVVQLRWEDDWDGAATDLDLYLYNAGTRLFTHVKSEDEQSGKRGQVPLERFWFTLEGDSNAFSIVVNHFSGGIPDWIQLGVWGVAEIEHYTGNGSINNPSESANPGMLAVGAAHWYDVRAIEPYSSRGPTPDGRVKPDIVGADCGVTALIPLDEYNEGFCGTSQAGASRGRHGGPGAPAVPRLHPATGSRLPEGQRGAAGKPGPQQHLGPRVRPNAVFPDPGNIERSRARRLGGALQRHRRSKLDKQRQLGEQPARWPLARRDHRPQRPGCWAVPPRERTERGDTDRVGQPRQPDVAQPQREPADRGDAH